MENLDYIQHKSDLLGKFGNMADVHKKIYIFQDMPVKRIKINIYVFDVDQIIICVTYGTT